MRAIPNRPVLCFQNPDLVTRPKEIEDYEEES